MTLDDLLLIHVASTWALIGLIWMVQLVVYPGFADVGDAQLASFHERHCRRITWVVGPLMGAELVSGLALLSEPPPGASVGLLWAGMGLVALSWLCTGLVSVPLHARLAVRDRARVQARLVSTNWIRTLAWSVRGPLVLLLLG
jgi:hypothetical protein